MSDATNPYGPQTDAERAANEEAARRAVALVAQMYMTEAKGRPLNRRLRDQRSAPNGSPAGWLARPREAAGEHHLNPRWSRWRPCRRAAHTGRMQPTGPELGAQARAALWRFSASTRTEGAARDRLGVATVRSQYPVTHGLFSDAALIAVLRPPESDGCSWDHYRDLARERRWSPGSSAAAGPDRRHPAGR
jgi:hypothetical protein